MELTIKINTDDALSLDEARELERQRKRKRITAGELVAQFIREGIAREKKGGRK